MKFLNVRQIMVLLVVIVAEGISAVNCWLGYHDLSTETNFNTQFVLCLYISCNALIFIVVLYLAQYSLRDQRYNWKISLLVFIYVLMELISVLILLTEMQRLEYAVYNTPLNIILFVNLFIFNIQMFVRFNELEYIIREQQLTFHVEDEGTPTKPGKTKHCVRVFLIDPGRQQQQSAASVTSSRASTAPLPAKTQSTAAKPATANR